jgi:hypothetical protein
MEKVIIHYGIQGNGMRFNLTFKSYNDIKSAFPDAQPAKGLFVEYDFRTNFAVYHPHLENYVFPALLGLANQEDLKKIKRIEFTQSLKGEATYIIEQNPSVTQNDLKIQLVSG